MVGRNPFKASVRLSASRKVDLPRHTEAVVDPSELAAETVVVEGHQRPAPFAQGLIEPLDFVLGLTGDEEGERRREGEGVLDRAVDAHDHLVLENEPRLHDRALGAGLAGAIALDVEDLGLREERDIEGHRLLGVALKHEKRVDLNAQR